MGLGAMMGGQIGAGFGGQSTGIEYAPMMYQMMRSQQQKQQQQQQQGGSPWVSYPDPYW